MLGTSPQPEGITNPPIDDLLEKVDSKYGLVVEAAKRARQINTYIRQLEENRFEFFHRMCWTSRQLQHSLTTRTLATAPKSQGPAYPHKVTKVPSNRQLFYRCAGCPTA